MLEEERRWLIVASLGSTLAVFLFFVLAPAAGYPLTYEDALGVVQIIVPVFMGYLGTAAQYVFAKTPPDEPSPHKAARPLLRLMVRGPVLVFLTIILASIVSFGLTNREDAQIGTGMSVSLLSAVVTASLALLAVTTNAAVAYLFTAQSRE
jgi:hypothetical protein